VAVSVVPFFHGGNGGGVQLDAAAPGAAAPLLDSGSWCDDGLNASAPSAAVPLSLGAWVEK